MKLVKDQIYKIYWTDKFSLSGWRSEKYIDEQKRMDIESVGHFVKENKYYYIFSMGICMNDDFHHNVDILWIPKGTVIKIKKIKT